jgi:SAM-dependent methyltransferase
MLLTNALRFLFFGKWFVFSYSRGPARYIRAFLYGGDFCRNFEYPLVYTRLELHKGHTVLDVGSGESGIFPLFLNRHGISVTAVDTKKEFYKGMHAFKEMAKAQPNLFLPGKLASSVADSRYLPFRSGSFARVCNIGSIEHVRGDGDTQTMREMVRVLKPGGLLVISVPFGKRYVELEDSPYSHYFMRWYDAASIQKRLIEPSGLSVKSVDYFGSRGAIDFYKFWDARSPLFKNSFHFLMPLFTALVIKRMKPEDSSRAAGICITLEKARG